MEEKIFSDEIIRKTPSPKRITLEPVMSVPLMVGKMIQHWAKLEAEGKLSFPKENGVYSVHSFLPIPDFQPDAKGCYPLPPLAIRQSLHAIMKAAGVVVPEFEAQKKEDYYRPNPFGEGLQWIGQSDYKTLRLPKLLLTSLTEEAVVEKKASGPLYTYNMTNSALLREDRYSVVKKCYVPVIKKGDYLNANGDTATAQFQFRAHEKGTAIKLMTYGVQYSFKQMLEEFDKQHPHLLQKIPQKRGRVSQEVQNKTQELVTPFFTAFYEQLTKLCEKERGNKTVTAILAIPLDKLTEEEGYDLYTNLLEVGKQLAIKNIDFRYNRKEKMIYCDMNNAALNDIQPRGELKEHFFKLVKENTSAKGGFAAKIAGQKSTPKRYELFFDALYAQLGKIYNREAQQAEEHKQAVKNVTVAEEDFSIGLESLTEEQALEIFNKLQKAQEIANIEGLSFAFNPTALSVECKIRQAPLEGLEPRDELKGKFLLFVNEKGNAKKGNEMGCLLF